MKKKILILLFLVGFFAQSKAVIHHIGVDGCSFNPSVNNSIHLGDTIRWYWDAYVPRRTSSLNVPPGAISWDEQLDVTNQEFQYVPTVAGQYFYKSNIMPTCIASFMILAPVGINELDKLTSTCAFFPNPAKTTFLLIHPKNASTVQILDLEGKIIQEETLDIKETNDEITLNGLKPGNYMINVRQKRTLIYSSKLIVID